MYGNARACTDHVAAAAGANRTTDRHSTTTVRAATSSEPRSRTFQPACRNAAASANASASGGTREHALGGSDERVAECKAELVPVLDLCRSLRPQRIGILRRILRVVDPPEDLGVRHLGMELHGPARLADAICLVAPLVPCQLDPARRDVVRVVVPLERLEPLRQPLEQGIVGAPFDVLPADLGTSGEGPAPRAECTRDQ